MAKMQLNPSTQQTYDPRWFIWAIMFLLATGVGLVVHITISTDDTADSQVLVRHQSSNVVQNPVPAEKSK